MRKCTCHMCGCMKLSIHHMHIVISLLRVLKDLHSFKHAVCLIRMFSVYSDTFNENEPPTNDPSYIALLGASVYNAMQAGDEEAVWLMQV